MTTTTTTAMNGHPKTSSEHSFDVVIIGAGISGINAAYRLQSQLPNYSYAVLEARHTIGGTWDLFKYPGIRSDSDLFTFGFGWHPWNQSNPIAEGGAVSKYIGEAVEQHGIDSHILFHHRVISADWSSADCVWSLNVDNQGADKHFKARFVVFGTGYYNYHEPLHAPIPGLDNFEGQVIHPQFWPEDLDYTDKKVVIVGSGATAVTLLPSMTEKASLVTMLQRSPTYYLSLPNANTSSFLGRMVPTFLAQKAQRWSHLFGQRALFHFCQSFPRLSRWLLIRAVRRQLPKHISDDPHFQPRYNPWDQRMCICPDGDFFKGLRSGRADVKTESIKQVTQNSIQLSSGAELEADIIITATGLKLQVGGGTKISMDGEKLHFPDKYMWNGVMLQDVPNASFIIGYTDQSWTLGADATAWFICRLLQTMESKKMVAAIPRLDDESTLQKRRLLNLSSTYVNRAEKDLPKAGDRAPWRPRTAYLTDYFFSQYGQIDNCLEWVPNPAAENKKSQ